MEKLTKNQRLIVLYIISAILLEMVFFLCLGFGVFPEYFWFDLCVILIAAGLIYLAQNFIAQSIIFWIFIMLQIVLCVTNIIVKNAAGELFALEMLFLSEEGLRAFEKSFIDFFRCTFIGVMLILIVFAFIYVCKTKNHNYVYKRKNYSLVLAYFLIFSFVGTSGYIAQKQLIKDADAKSEFYVFESDKYLYSNLTSKTEAFKKFGTFGFYIKNVSNLFSEGKLSKEEKIETVDYLLDAKQIKSEYNGLSSGNNVMTILLETMEYYAIDPYFTPNLYNIFFESSDTIKLNNFFANNRTNISEGLVLFGSYDKQYPVNAVSDEVMDIFKNDVKFTLPGLLKEKGYSTTYYHDYCSWYYNRNITHKAAGFDKIVGLEDMDQLEKWVDFDKDGRNKFYEWKNWTLDSDVMTAYFDEMTNSPDGEYTGQNFFTHFSLITMHGNHEKRSQLQHYYDELTADIGVEGGHFDKMLEFIGNMGYSIPKGNNDIYNHFLWYKTAAMDVDKMVGILLDNLANTKANLKGPNGEDLSLLDTTTVVFFADHNCYYNGLANHMRGLDYSTEEYDTELFRIPCAIMDKKVAKAYYENNGTTVIDKFTSTYNILPTTLDILGVDYNPALYYGDCLFNEGINVFQSNISGNPYFTDQFLLSYSTIKWSETEVSKEEKEAYMRSALKTFNRIKYINNIYKYPEILDMYNEKLNATNN